MNPIGFAAVSATSGFPKWLGLSYNPHQGVVRCHFARKVGHERPRQDQKQLICELEALRQRVTALESVEAERRQTVELMRQSEADKRKRAEEALRVSDERIRQAVRAANLGVFEHDHRTDVIQWSPEMRQVYGIGPDEPVSIPMILAFYHPDDRESIAAAIQQAHDPTGDGIYSGDSRIVRRDGTVRWLIRRSKTFFDNEAGTLRPVVTIGVVLDITDRKRAEEALREAHDQLEQKVRERTRELRQANERLQLEVEERQRTEAALRESEAKYKTLVETSPDASSLADPARESHVRIAWGTQTGRF